MSNTRAIVRGTVLVFLSCCGCSAPSEKPPEERGSTLSTSTTTTPAPRGAGIGVALPSTILKRTLDPKGGSINPPAPPLFTLLTVNAALTGSPKSLNKANIEATLRNLLQTVRREAEASPEDTDGITVFLYQTVEHANGANAALGRAEWWPEGHSFAISNAANVRNKATHVESIEVFTVPDTAVAASKSRLPENVRREIFSALVRSEDRGTREAEARYPTDANKIPPDKLSTYDWKTVLQKNAEYEDTLQQKYQRELLAKYKISEAELDAIRDEASAQQWPLPGR